VIEATVFQATFVHELLSRTQLPAIPVRPDRDKVTRARALAARYEAGKVFHLRSAPGLTDFEDELVAFPNAAHDDQVDAAVYGADLGTPTPARIPLPDKFLYSFRRGGRRPLPPIEVREPPWWHERKG